MGEGRALSDDGRSRRHSMKHLSSTMIAVSLLSALALPAAAQSTAPAKPGASMSDKASATADDVKNWTRKKWNAAKREWQKDTAKWSSCDDEAKAKKLTGRASWSFFYTCMKA
jgi:hypothetical protein